MMISEEQISAYMNDETYWLSIPAIARLTSKFTIKQLTGMVFNPTKAMQMISRLTPDGVEINYKMLLMLYSFRLPERYEFTYAEDNSHSQEVREHIGGKFKPGVSGNPAGRRKGAKNKTTILREEIEEIAGVKSGKFKDVINVILTSNDPSAVFEAAKMIRLANIERL